MSVRSHPIAPLVMLAVALAGASTELASAQPHDHRPTGSAIAAALPFATTCRPAIAGLIDRGVHQVHTLAFADAVGTFRQAAHSDIDCTIAYWGMAMAHWGRFARSGATEALAEGWKALDQAALARRQPAARERRYLDALQLRYRERLHDGQARYAAAMAALAADHPTDPHAALLAARARLERRAATAAEADAAGFEALALLTRPGVPPGHVATRLGMVMAGDAPGVAARVVEQARSLAAEADPPARLLLAARRVFERLGRWDEAIAVGLRATDTARAAGAGAEELEGLDGLVYAWLQAGRLDEARAVARRLDGGYLAEAPGLDVSAVGARIAARIALDADDAIAAAALAVPDDTAPAALAPRLFARVLGAAALGRGDDAAAGARRLEGIAARPGTAPETTRLARAAGAWAAMARARAEDALAQLRAVADEEDHAVDDGVRMPLRPAREQLADLLRLLRRDGEAAAAYRETLARWPGRRRASTALEAMGRDRLGY